MSDTLHQLRTSIDAIDEQIAHLLLKRQGFVHQVGELKKQSGDTGSFIRPDREATMVRTVLQKFKGTDFHPAAAAQLWRIMIGAALSLESPLGVSVSSRQPAALTLVREFFGNFIPATLRDDDEKIITDCLASPHTIGVISTHGTESSWWASLAQHSQLRIFAKLPFVMIPDDSLSSEVYLLGQVKPAETSEDETLILAPEGKLEIKKGFHPDAEGAIGTYAVPVNLG